MDTNKRIVALQGVPMDIKQDQLVPSSRIIDNGVSSVMSKKEHCHYGYALNVTTIRKSLCISPTHSLDVAGRSFLNLECCRSKCCPGDATISTSTSDIKGSSSGEAIRQDIPHPRYDCLYLERDCEMVI